MPSIVSKLLAWLGDHELTVLVGMTIVVVGAWVFIELAGEVLEGDTQGFDEWVVRALRDENDLANPLGPPWAEEVGRDITALGGYAVLTLVTVVVAGFLRLARMVGAMRFLLIAVVGGFILGMTLKSVFSRPRPSIVPHLSHVYTTSFPSGHSMMSAIVYLTLGTLLTAFVSERRLKVYILSVAVFVAGLVGLSRIYMGVHYPTDVLAGWTAGLVWSITCWLVARWLQRRGTIESQFPERSILFNKRDDTN